MIRKKLINQASDYFHVFESIFNILKLTVDHMALFEIQTDTVFVSVFWFSGWNFTVSLYSNCSSVVLNSTYHIRMAMTG